MIQLLPLLFKGVSFLGLGKVGQRGWGVLGGVAALAVLAFGWNNISGWWERSKLERANGRLESKVEKLDKEVARLTVLEAQEREANRRITAVVEEANERAALRQRELEEERRRNETLAMEHTTHQLEVDRLRRELENPAFDEVLRDEREWSTTLVPDPVRRCLREFTGGLDIGCEGIGDRRREDGLGAFEFDGTELWPGPQPDPYQWGYGLGAPRMQESPFGRELRQGDYTETWY